MKIDWRHISHSNRGMTLVELLLVLGALGIILGLAMPSIKSLGSGIILHTEAIRMAQDIRYTQHISLTRRENYMLQLDIKEDFYFIKPIKKFGAPTVKRVHLNKNIHFNSCTFRRDEKSYRYYIEFNSLTGIPGQTGSVELVDNYGNIRKIVVEPTTGRVRVGVQ